MTRKRIKEHCSGAADNSRCRVNQLLVNLALKKPLNTEVGIELIVLLDHAFAVIYAAHLTKN